MSFISFIQNMIGKKALKRFHQQCADPMKIQKDLLDHIVTKNEETMFGQDYNFKNIYSFEDFQNLVPLANYDDLQPYIEEELKGNRPQLTKDKPIFFATTSGTTGAKKYIPLTHESCEAKSDLMRVWTSSIFKDYPKVLEGKFLMLVSPEVESVSPSGISCGSQSGRSYRKIPFYIRSLYSSPYEAFGIKDFEAKYYTILRIAADQKITFLYACNPSTVLLLAKQLGKYTKQIIRDIREGTLSDEFDIPADIRKSVRKYMKPNPERAAFLEQAALIGGGELLPKYIWPDLQVIACWKGGTVGHDVEKFQDYFQKDLPVRDIGYFASEHFSSIPMSDDGCDGVLSIANNIYEFYPVENEKKPAGPDLLTLNQLEAGKQYYIYVTTLAGLYRYNMDDIIEVTGYHKKTPCIKFIQKRKGITSMVGEKLTETQVLKTVEEVFSSRQGRYEFISAIGLNQGETPYYTFLVEFDDDISASQKERLAADLDYSLKCHNIEYMAKRNSMRLGAAEIRVIKRGEFTKYRKRKVEDGKSDGTFKILRLSLDTAFGAEFEEVISEAVPCGVL